MAGEYVLSILMQAQNQAGGAISSFLSDLGPIGGAAVAVGAAVVGIGVSSVKMAADFQQSMLKVQAYAGLSKKQTDDMSNSIMTMASNLGQSPKAMADAIYPIISSGYSASESLNILGLSAKTAGSSGANMATVADMLTTSLKASNAPASDAGHYMDMFNKIVSLGKGEVPQYAAVIGKLTLAAGSAKVPFDQMGGALATLTTHGFPSVAQASNSLGNLFTQIGPKVDALKQHADKLKISFDEDSFKTMNLSDKLSYLQKVTGGNQGELLKLLGGSTLALKAFTALTGSTQDLTSNMNAMKDSAGATDAAYKVTSGGFTASMNRMNSTVQVFMISIGQKLLPILTNLVNQVAPIITSFASWVTTSGALDTISSVLSGTISVISTVIGGLVTGITNVVTWFINVKGPGEVVRALLVGIGAAFAIIQIGSFIATIPALVAGFIAWATAAGAAAIATLAAMAPLLLIGIAIAAAVALIVLAVTHWGAIMDWITGKTEQTRLQNEIKHSQMAQAADKHTADQAKNALANIEKERAGIIEKLKNCHDTTEKAELTHQLDLLNKQEDGQKQRLKKADEDAAKQKAAQAKAHADLLEAQKNWFQRMLDSIGSFFGNIFSAIGTFTHNALSAMGKWFGDMFSGLGTWVHNMLSKVGELKDQFIAHIIELWNMVQNKFWYYFDLIKAKIEEFKQTLIDKVMTLKNEFIAHITDLWNMIQNKFWYYVDLIKAKVEEFKQNLIDKAQNLKDQFVQKVTDLITNVRTFFTNLPGEALTWGQNLIQSFINGIQNMIGAVGTAASNVVNTVKSFLGFHSPAAQGPGSDADMWAPNLMKMYANGIQGGMAGIKVAVKKAAELMKAGFTPAANALNQQINAAQYQQYLDKVAAADAKYREREAKHAAQYHSAEQKRYEKYLQDRQKALEKYDAEKKHKKPFHYADFKPGKGFKELQEKLPKFTGLALGAFANSTTYSDPEMANGSPMALAAGQPPSTQVYNVTNLTVHGSVVDHTKLLNDLQKQADKNHRMQGTHVVVTSGGRAR